MRPKLGGVSRLPFFSLGTRGFPCFPLYAWCQTFVHDLHTNATPLPSLACSGAKLHRFVWPGRGGGEEGPPALERRAYHGPPAHRLHTGQRGDSVHGHPPDIVLLQALSLV